MSTNGGHYSSIMDLIIPIEDYNLLRNRHCWDWIAISPCSPVELLVTDMIIYSWKQLYWHMLCMSSWSSHFHVIKAFVILTH